MIEKWTVAEIPSQAGKLAVVTGANSGIGWQTALELARAGSDGNGCGPGQATMGRTGSFS